MTPSQHLRIRDDYVAHCLDEAVAFAGLYFDIERQQQVAKETEKARSEQAYAAPNSSGNGRHREIITDARSYPVLTLPQLRTLLAATIKQRGEGEITARLRKRITQIERRPRR